MTLTEDVVEPDEPRMVPAVEYHPKDPNATPESLARLAGIITVSGPTPSRKFLEEQDEDDEELIGRASD